jgi:transposase-like protein
MVGGYLAESPLAPLYAILYLDAIHLEIWQKSKVENGAVHVVLGDGVDGHRDVLVIGPAMAPKEHTTGSTCSLPC